MKSIEQAEIIEGTIVLIRTDWNLPLDKEGEVLDTSRIEASVKTINFCLEKGAKVIIMSHLQSLLGEGLAKQKTYSLLMVPVSGIYRRKDQR